MQQAYTARLELSVGGQTIEGNAPLTEAELEARIRDDQARMRRYYDSLGQDDEAAGSANPAHQLAPAYFRVYLERRPSPLATRALGRALCLWGQVRGASGHVRQAVAQVGPDEDVWVDEAVGGVLNSLWKDHGFAAAVSELEAVAWPVKPDQSRAMLLYTLSRRWMETGAQEKARQACEEILRLDTSRSPFYVEPFARGCLYEIDCLNVGQLAPVFALPDIDGNLVALQRYRGRVVLLSFWAEHCGACPREFPHLRRLAAGYPTSSFAIIGVALDEGDEDLAALRCTIQREELSWPHICDGTGWDAPLAKLFNTRALPDSYLLDADGRIAAKNTDADAVGRLVDCLLGRM